MAKTIFLLLVGFAAGYSYGFKDAKVHDEDVVTRTVERVGGATRERYKSDVDERMEQLERR
jgi:hypothetical protein